MVREMFDNDDLKAVAIRAAMGPLAYGGLALLGMAQWSWTGVLGAVLLAIAVFGSARLLGKDWQGR